MSEYISEQKITKRKRMSYSLEEQAIMKNDKQIILLQLENLSLKGKSVIFENQEIIASTVVTTFKSRKIINIMVVSKTQSGKTGSMCATIKKYLEDSDNLIPIENIYIITGLSSCEWKDQTKERMPESIQNRVFHRSELPKTFVDEIKDKKNILIIMDEIQVAAKQDQTIYNTFDKAGILDKSKLYEKDIKILEYTATPDGTIYDLMEWKDASSKILADVGDGYVSCYDLLEMGRIKQFKDLCGYNIYNHIEKLYYKNLEELLEGQSEESVTVEKNIKMISDFIIKSAKDFIMYNKKFDTNSYNELIQQNNLETYIKITNINAIEIFNHLKEIFKNIQEIKNDINKYQHPLYHIIRTKHADAQELTIQNLKHIFNDYPCDYIKYDGNSDITDINKLLREPPKKHTFILIKEMLRCSKTLHKKFIGILYERYVKTPDDSTIIQGLVGRDTGYDNNGISICYTNIKSIEKYEILWNSKFEDTTIPWNSKTTKNIRGVLSGKNTFNDPKAYDGFSETSEDSIEQNIDTEYKEFSTQEEAIKFGKDALGKKFNKRDKFEAPKEVRKDGKNPSCDELVKRMWGINVDTPARMIPTRNETLGWCVYWRPSLIKK